MLVSAASGAADFFSVAANGTLFYDAPSAKAKKLFVVSQLYPVEVRDVSGKLAWVEKKQLTDKRTVVVSAARADIRQSPDDAATLVFQAEAGVALEFVESVPGWIKVRHRDGQTGFVKLNQVWGA
jgi:SH3-like domain-containing protein